MNIAEYLENTKEIQKNILDFVDNEEDSDYYIQNLQTIFDKQKIQDNKHNLTQILHLITKIIDNHYRFPSFFEKIEKILLIFKDSIKNHYSNYEIFNIFKSNKKILLFLIEEKIMIFNSDIAKKITTSKYIKQYYPQYFLPELNLYKNEKWFPKNDVSKFEIPNNFYEHRKEGQNDKYVCKLIQKDLIKEFIIFVNQNNYPLDSTISKSIYETNSFLMRKQEITLIEYAAFYGSIQIFLYLKNNKVKLTQSLWIYSIHSNNPEMIQMLVDNLGNKEKELFKLCFIESIKCHHNEFAYYFLNNYLQYNEEILQDAFVKGIKYYNFYFFFDELIDEYSFYDFCRYDYYLIVQFQLQKIILSDINKYKEIIKDYYYDDETREEKIMYGSHNFDGGKIKYEKTALYLAVEKENIEIVKLLLSKDEIDLNSLNSLRVINVTHNEYAKTVLYLAVEKENIEIIKLLLTNDELNIDVLNTYSGSCIYNKTALYLAVEKENIEIIKLLLTKDNFDINTLNKYKQGLESSFYAKRIEHTVFHLAIEKENIEIIKLFLTNDRVNVNAFCIQSQNKKEFVSHKTTKIKSRKTPLYMAIEKKCDEIIKILVTNDRVDVNVINENSIVDGGEIIDIIEYETYEQTALYLAVESGNINALKYLLMNDKIDVNIRKESYYKKEKVLDKLINSYFVHLRITTGSSDLSLKEVYNKKNI